MGQPLPAADRGQRRVLHELFVQYWEMVKAAQRLQRNDN